MTIRHTTLKDAERIGFINSASWRTTYTGLIDEKAFEAMTPETMLAKWTNIISICASTKSFVLVAEEEKEIVGYIFCGPNDSADTKEFEWILFGLYLLQEYQGKGIGKALFVEAVKEMKHLQAHSFALYVLSSNTKARTFYESYKPVHIHNTKIIIDGIEYDDTFYGWSDITAIECN